MTADGATELGGFGASILLCFGRPGSHTAKLDWQEDDALEFGRDVFVDITKLAVVAASIAATGILESEGPSGSGMCR